MADDQWIETKKEFEYDAEGKPTLKKHTAEPKPPSHSKKDKIDLFFRLVGLLAIGIPIFLVFLQQKASLRNQKATQQFEVYSASYMELNSIMNRPSTSTEFEKACNKFNNELVPKICFIYHEDICSAAEEVTTTIPLYSMAAGISALGKTIYDLGNSGGSALNSLKYSDEIPVFDREYSLKLKLGDSLRQELIYQMTTLKKVLETADKNSAVFAGLKSVADSCQRMNEVFSDYFDQCAQTEELLKKKHFPFGAEEKKSFDELGKVKEKFGKLAKINVQAEAVSNELKKYLIDKIKLLISQMRKTNSWLD